MRVCGLTMNYQIWHDSHHGDVNISTGVDRPTYAPENAFLGLLCRCRGYALQ